MGELRIVAIGRGRSQAEDLLIELRNLTAEILVGSTIFRGVETPVLPVRSGSSVTVAIPTAQIRSKTVAASLNFRTFPHPDVEFTEGLELDAQSYRRYVVELSVDDGEPAIRVRRAVGLMWSAGKPELTPVVTVTDDDGEVYTLRWPSVAERENGPIREVLLDGVVEALAVSGTFVDKEEEWYIEPEDEEHLDLPIEGPFGFFLLQRNLDQLDEEEEEDYDEDE